jgi:hypothetical protein
MNSEYESELDDSRTGGSPFQRRTTRGRAWLAIAVATLIVIGILYGEIWTLERGFSSTTACYVALSNDLVPLMSVDEMDFAATNPACDL